MYIAIAARFDIPYLNMHEPKCQLRDGSLSRKSWDLE